MTDIAGQNLLQVSTRESQEMDEASKGTVYILAYHAV
jgi:hypothetical protein